MRCGVRRFAMRCCIGSCCSDCWEKIRTLHAVKCSRFLNIERGDAQIAVIGKRKLNDFFQAIVLNEVLPFRQLFALQFTISVRLTFGPGLRYRRFRTLIVRRLMHTTRKGNCRRQWHKRQHLLQLYSPSVTDRNFLHFAL